ncbi:MAG: hypothetical protein AAGB05_03675 [Pseudomonadota bacterium]
MTAGPDLSTPDGTGDDPVLARLTPSPGRRSIGTGMLAVLGALVLWVALAHPPQQLGWLAFLLAAAALAFWSARAMWRATSHSIVLTRSSLSEEHGRVIARVDAIASVDRGLFAFKPSNGFLLRLKAPAPRSWSLGMWWRLGRRVGVGGVTPGGQGRAMADILLALLPDRDQDR